MGEIVTGRAGPFKQSKLAMSAIKDKPKKGHGSHLPATDDGEHASKRKSKRLSKKMAKLVAPRELVNAVKEERVGDVKRIIEENESLKKCFTDVETKQTLFHAAIRTGSLELVETLISLGVSTCDVDLKFRNALHYLTRVKAPSQGLIDAIIGIKGLNLSEEDVSGATPLHLAIRYNNTLLSQTLIRTPSTYPTTALYRCFRPHWALFEDVGADFLPCTTFFFLQRLLSMLRMSQDSHLFTTPAMKAKIQLVRTNPLKTQSRGRHEDFLFFQRLPAFFASWPLLPPFRRSVALPCSLPASRSISPSSHASFLPTLTITDSLTSYGTRVAIDLFTRTKIVQQLLEAGADASAQDHKGNTPLHYACDTGSLAIGKMLLAKAVDVMALNSKGDTPLHRAVERKQETMCAWLVNNGADVMIRYEKRLYEDRHKVSRRKYLRQAVRGNDAKEAVPPRSKAHRNADIEIEDEAGGKKDDKQGDESDSDGEDLPDDPEGMLTLHDHLDTYGFLVGSEKSNQLVAGEAAAVAHASEKAHVDKGSSGSKSSKSAASGKKTKGGAKADQLDDDQVGGSAAGSNQSGPSADSLHELEKSQRKLIKKWVKISRLFNDKGSAAVHKAYSEDKFRKLLYKGIPNHVRAGVWRLIGATLDAKNQNPGRYEHLSAQPISRKTSHQLDIDINRTNRSHFLFKERYGQGQISLFCILRAYSVLDPVVGYCQGMSDITALMMQYIEEEEAFWLLVRVMQNPLFNMAERFEDDFKGLKRAWYVHDKLLAVQLPRLAAHLAAGKIEAAHYTIKWYLKCFLDALSFDCVLRVWDVLLLEGSDVLYTFVFTLLRYHEAAILAIDPAELLMHLPLLKGPPAHISVDSWLKDVKKNPIKPKLLRTFEAEFDAQWPAMIAAIKEEADRKQDEWNKRREKAKQKEDEIAAAQASKKDDVVEKPAKETKETNDTIVQSPSSSSVTEKSKAKRRSKIVSPSSEAEEEAAPVEAVEKLDIPNGHAQDTTPTKKRASKRGSSKRKSQRAEAQVDA